MSAALPVKAGGLLPIAGICCLALTAFLIATTIVLALIPVYVPKKDVTVVVTPEDDAKFQLQYSATSSNEDDDVAGNIDNLDDFRKALNLDDDVELTDGFVQTELSEGSGRRRRRSLLQRHRRDIPSRVIYKIIINIVCKYKIKNGCMGKCRNNIKDKVDKSIAKRGDLPGVRLRVKCGTETYPVSTSSFSYSGRPLRQASPPAGYGAVDSLEFIPIASGDINDPKIWKNGVRPFGKCRVTVPSGIRLSISQSPYLPKLLGLTVAKGANLSLGSAGQEGFVFARISKLDIGGTCSFLGTGGAIQLPRGCAFNFLAGAIYSGATVAFQIVDYSSGAIVGFQQVVAGIISAVIAFTTAGVVVVGGTTASSSTTTTPSVTSAVG